jgi:hypothetical protein
VPVSALSVIDMSTKFDSHGRTAQGTNQDPSDRGRDGRETAQDDGSTESDKESPEPPNHQTPTHGRARFLWETDPRTPVDELGELWRRWEDSGEQADLGEWSR